MASRQRAGGGLKGQTFRTGLEATSLGPRPADDTVFSSAGVRGAGGGGLASWRATSSLGLTPHTNDTGSLQSPPQALSPNCHTGARASTCSLGGPRPVQQPSPLPPHTTLTGFVTLSRELRLHRAAPRRTPPRRPRLGPLLRRRLLLRLRVASQGSSLPPQASLPPAPLVPFAPTGPAGTTSCLLPGGRRSAGGPGGRRPEGRDVPGRGLGPSAVVASPGSRKRRETQSAK